MWDRIWVDLGHGVASSRHGFHSPVLATVGADGAPEVRTMVLRAIDRSAGLVVCHTDVRSPKVAELARDGRTGWLFYHREGRHQLRCSGIAEVLTEGPAADEAWARTRLSSRRCYLAPRPPSTVSAGPSANLPDDLLDHDPTEERSRAGRLQFGIVRARLHVVETLVLSHGGHRRARFERDVEADTWRGSWLEP